MGPFYVLIFFILGWKCNYVISQIYEDETLSKDNAVNDFIADPFIGCSNETYPPIYQYRRNVWEYVIDLDKPPEERWVEVITATKTDLSQCIEMVKNKTLQMFGDKIFKLIDSYLPWFFRTLPKEYYYELLGISMASGLTIRDVITFNIFSEFYSASTSIVMESDEKRIYLGRNLDFGYLHGWNIKNNTLIVPELLQSLVFLFRFIKNNQTMYRSVGFAGYIGIHSAVKKDAFGVSVNERFKFDDGYVDIAEWIIDRYRQKWIGLFIREMMESADSYTQAQKLLYTSNLVAPAYFTLAGRKSHQGCVITRGKNDSDVWSLDNYSDSVEENGKWFLVQTNYDHWKKPPSYDNKLDPANLCMERFGSDNADATLYKVFATRPIFNKFTIFTATMEIDSGAIAIFIRPYEDPH